MTQREKKLIAMLVRKIEIMRPFLCSKIACKDRSRADVCPHCGCVINLPQ